jgi:opacity protein-like surface antigen
MSRKLLAIACTALSFGLANRCWADDLDKPIFSIAGFGTLGVVHSSEDQADFVENYLQPTGAGYTSNWSGSVDSRLGVQFTGNFTPSLSAVVQVVSEQRYDDSYEPTVEWANLKYQVTPDFSVRVGRIALPSFLAADYRDVGYAMPWVRTPEEVYDLVPITNSDGIDFRYRMHIGEANSTWQASFGVTNIGAPGGYSATVRAIRGITNTTEFGSTTIRVNYLQGKLSLNSADALFDGFNEFGPPGVAITNRYNADDKVASFAGIGINYDPGQWFLMAEIGQAKTNSFIGNETGGYISSGYRFGKIAPYITLARVDGNSNRSDPGLPTTGLPPQLAAEAMGLNQGLNDILASLAIQKSVAIGVRWDAMKNVAFKAEYEAIQLGAGSPGNLINPQPDFTGGGRVNVFSVLVDFVF